MSVDGQSEGNRPSPPPTHLNIASWDADKSFRRCHIDFFAHCLAQKLDVITVIDYGHHLYVNFEYIKDTFNYYAHRKGNNLILVHARWEHNVDSKKSWAHPSGRAHSITLTTPEGTYQIYAVYMYTSMDTLARSPDSPQFKKALHIYRAINKKSLESTYNMVGADIKKNGRDRNPPPGQKRT
jgi:hypothetical protein